MHCFLVSTRKLLYIFVYFQELYQESDTQKLTIQFKRQEDENFALFSYVNELSHEVEVLNDTTQELSDEIGKQIVKKLKILRVFEI